MARTARADAFPVKENGNSRRTRGESAGFRARGGSGPRDRKDRRRSGRQIGVKGSYACSIRVDHMPEVIFEIAADR